MLEAIDTCNNPKGLCAVSYGREPTVLVTPEKNAGQVRVKHFEKDTVKIINAHQSQIAALALNYEGTILATASDKGTLVRIYDTQAGDQL